MVICDTANPLKVALVAGARPNFVKVAPILKAMQRMPDAFSPTVIHTGQHYGAVMSENFFKDLGMRQPDYHLGAGSGSHAEQTARVMLALEPVLEQIQPDWVLVVGDVNSTVAAALTSVKQGFRTAHVEAGLRSFDRTMPEEINRIVTDSICDLLLTPSEDADQNLRREGIPETRIVRVGNVMIDSLSEHLPAARRLRLWEEFGFEEGRYMVVTMHRPSNVDEPNNLAEIVAALHEVGKQLPVLFPVHPRSARHLISKKAGSWSDSTLHFSEPLGYLSFLSLLSGSGLVLTDSGGIQEEACFLGVPCLTFRDNTERPVTISHGSNEIIGTKPQEIVSRVHARLRAGAPVRRPIPMWDGRSAERIATAILHAQDSAARQGQGMEAECQSPLA